MTPLKKIDRTSSLIPKEVGRWYFDEGRFVFYENYFNCTRQFPRLRIQGLLL